MSIEMRVEPGVVKTRKEFEQYPPYSIALDGYVDASPGRIGEAVGNAPMANFDHHKGVDRLATRATCEQVYVAIQMGLMDAFSKDGVPTATLYVNDCDQDVCLSIWLILNHEQVRNHAYPAINRLVRMEDLLDATGGAYGFGDTQMMRKMAWVFELCSSGRGQSPDGMRSVIEATLSRITAHVMGDGQELSHQGEYEVLGGGDGWSLVKEKGPYARQQMYADGITRFVSILNENQDGSYVYTIGRRSIWNNWPWWDIFKALNTNDPAFELNNNWAGSDIIGGSPRNSGSLLTPKEVEDIINQIMESG